MCLNVAFPPVAPSEPVGVAMASKHVGSQLIELSLSDKDFIAVSEEVSFMMWNCGLLLFPQDLATSHGKIP